MTPVKDIRAGVGFKKVALECEIQFKSVLNWALGSLENSIFSSLGHTSCLKCVWS